MLIPRFRADQRTLRERREKAADHVAAAEEKPRRKEKKSSHRNRRRDKSAESGRRFNRIVSGLSFGSKNR